MSGECEQCGEHAIECQCRYANCGPDWGVEDEGHTLRPVYVRDLVTRVQGLVRCVSLLIRDEEWKRYQPCPMDDLFIVIHEILDEMDRELKKP